MSATRSVVVAMVVAVVAVICAACGGGDRDGAGNADCATGTVTFTAPDPEGGSSVADRTDPARGVDWHLMSSSGAEIVSGTTSSDGSLRICAEPGAYELNVTASQGDRWQVVRGDVADHPVVAFTRPLDIAPGNSQIGEIATPPEAAGAFKIGDSVMLLHMALAGSDCWADGTCPVTYRVRWSPHSETDASYLDDDGSDNPPVVVSTADAVSRHVVIHESGHWLQARLNGSMPDVDAHCEQEHLFDVPSSDRCAFTEGFADAVAAFVLGGSDFAFADGDRIPLEEPGTASGPDVEGRVAAALLDLWRNVDRGWSPTLQLMKGKQVATLDDYLNERRNAGLDSPAQTAVLRAHTLIG